MHNISITQKLKHSEEYYRMQLDNIYEDTKFFFHLLKNKNLLDGIDSVLDIGCGGGSKTIHFAQHFPNLAVTGMDYQKPMITLAKKLADQTCVHNISFKTLDWFNIPTEVKNTFDLIFSFHAFCCFKHPEEPLQKIIDLQPKCIIIKSLFFDAPLDVLIHIRDEKHGVQDSDHDGDFNIFSMQKIKSILIKNGYTKVNFIPFNLDYQVNKPADGGRGSYTRHLDDEQYATFSGPVYLPWHFLVASKA
jgi:SAM-dependent methyltransferase